MASPRPRAQHAAIAAAVLALHGALCWLLLTRMRGVSIRVGSESLEIVLLPPAAAPPRRPNPKRAAPPSARQRAPRATPSQPTVAPEPSENHAIHPPIDWDAELARAAQDAGAAGSGRKFRDFGFPHAGAAPRAKIPQFGWDYAATHRVQPIEGGGILVNLNDNCVLVFVPLPFVFCKPGHKPTNGDLFEHMSPLEGEGNATE